MDYRVLRRVSHPTARLWLLAFVLGIVAVAGFAGAAGASSGPVSPNAVGGLDCNGFSPIQKTVKAPSACTDVRGFSTSNEYTWGGRFYDNGHYIGHDEPDLTFLSNKPGSGNDVTWTETLPRDPSAAPTVGTPGSDVTHWFELSVAPWFSMALCNPQSYPLLACTPNSDKNAPACVTAACPANSYPGGGSSFLEVQFYPPGFAPFADGISCDNSHWCASLHINDLECTVGFGSCNDNCIEPTNFAWIQKDGVPTGPASPQLADLSTFTPNSQTLLMNPGDQLRVHIFDAPAAGGGNALEVRVDDLTTGETGYMQASAANGYAQTQFADCSGVPFNYEPEYSTANQGNIVPWAALQTNISTQYEIGHFTPCSSLAVPAPESLLFLSFGDPFWFSCVGPYESPQDATDSSNPEGVVGDGFCFPAGDTHPVLGGTDPNLVTGCLDLFAGGDIDYDGTSYWADWPTGVAPTATTPGSFVQEAPTSNGTKYSQSFFQTDAALSEPSCTSSNIAGCTIPPPGPGNFYPYFSETKSKNTCTIEFGNVSSGPGVNTFGGDAQYGPNQFATLGYPEFEGKPTGQGC